MIPPYAITSPTEMACIGCEDVLVLLRDDRLAVPVLELDHPLLELLLDPRCEVLLVPRLEPSENGLLNMKKRPHVKRS